MGLFIVMSGDKMVIVNVIKLVFGFFFSVFYYKIGDMFFEDIEYIWWFLNINNDDIYVE